MKNLLQKNSAVSAYIASIITGLLLVLAFPPLKFPTFAFFAFVPLLLQLRKELKRPYLLIYITFFIYHTGTNWWISSFQELTDPFLFATGFVLDILHPLFFLVPFIGFRFIKERLGFNKALTALPFIWTAFEFLHSSGDLGYSWLNIGHTMVNYLAWLQFIDITGIYGAGFLIMLANVLLVKIFCKMIDEDLTFSKVLKKHSGLSIGLLSIIIIPGLYGFVRLQDYRIDNYSMDDDKIAKVMIVQPNINPWRKWESTPMELIKKHFLLQDSAIAESKEKFDMAVWGETAVPYLGVPYSNKADIPVLSDYVNVGGMSLLTGYVDTRIFPASDDAPMEAIPLKFDTTRMFLSYNSALMINPKYNQGEEVLSVHHKAHLTPFAERVPYFEVFGFMKSIIKWGVGISSWGQGDKSENLILHKGEQKIKVAPVICIESIFPGFVREFTNNGAEFITVITNDSWYDFTSGPEQHWNIARVRAIENRRFVVRSANSGVSGLISPAGKELAKLPQYKSTARGVPVPLLKDKSIYVRFGDWFAYTILLITIMFLIQGYMKKK